MFFGGDPFGGGFGGMGGMGGPKGPVDNKAYYDILGLTKDCSEADVKKAYRALARKHHPDKGGDVEKFKELSTAAEVLSDPKKRELYDKYGKEGVEQGGGEHHSANDIFSQFFGGGRGHSGPQKGEDIVHPIKASLEDLYNGKTTRLAINRNRLCEDCDGRGGKAGAEKTCNECNGRGMKISMRSLGPGMVQQIQSACGNCKATGKIMDEKDKCTSCKGKKVYKDRKVLEVVLEKGMKDGQKIRFSGEADELPDTVPGDVIFVIQEKPHELFKRKGADLVYTMNLELSEALCGFTKTITHFDGRVLAVNSRPGQIIKPDALKVIQGEGMPYHGNPFTKGRLFILFKVNFPASLSVTAVNAIKQALPAGPTTNLTGEEEECNMSDVDPSQIGKTNEQPIEDDDDEGHGGGGQRVQCNNM